MDPNESAERAVLARIFQRFPHSFVWIGGSVLQLIHRSARTSHDLDLTPTGELPLPSGLQTEINNALIEWNGLEVQSFALEENASPSDFKRFTVTNQGKHAFTIDIVRMGGASLSGTHTVLLSSSLGSATVVIPNDSTLLDQKVKAFLLRTYPKPGDLYDIWFLLDRGVKLSPVEREALADALEFAEIDRETALARLNRFSNSKWIGALERSGVHRLTAESASKVVDAARVLIEEVLP